MTLALTLLHSISFEVESEVSDGRDAEEGAAQDEDRAGKRVQRLIVQLTKYRIAGNRDLRNENPYFSIKLFLIFSFSISILLGGWGGGQAKSCFFRENKGFR